MSLFLSNILNLILNIHRYKNRMKMPLVKINAVNAAQKNVNTQNGIRYK